MGKEILPPATPSDVMAHQRWLQEVRRQARKQDVFNLQTIRDVSGGFPSQNLLSSSLLHPSADAQFTLSTTNAVHRNYLGPTIGTDAFGSLVDMGGSPGGVISASIEALPTGGQIAQVELIFSVSKVFSEDNSVSTTISTHLGSQLTADLLSPPSQPAGSPAETAVIASDFGITKIENITIPDGTVFVQINALSASSSGAGDITWRRAMLNFGATAVPYSFPPLRPDRENTLIGQQSYLELDGTDAYVTVPDNSAWDFAASVTRTIEIEFLVDDFSPLPGSPSAAEALLRKKLKVGNGWRVFRREGGTIGATVFSNDANFPDGEFATPLKKTHFAMTRDATGIHKLYVNGKFGVTFTDNTDIGNTAALLFGVFPLDDVGNFERFLDGRLYYVRIWDVVRTQQELIDDRHTIFPDSTTNLRGDWRFDEGSGTVVRNHGDVASTDGVIVGTGFRWIGPAVNTFPNFTNLPIETSIAAGDFLMMEDITDNGSGKITFANVESTLNHDALADFVADEHIDWTSASSNFLTSGTLTVSGVGPHSIGGSTDSKQQLTITGTFNPTIGTASALFLDTTINAVANQSTFGTRLKCSLIEASSGTHTHFATLQVHAPTIGVGSAALTTASTVRIVTAPTEGSNNYALLVDAGAVKFDETLELLGSLSAATQVFIGDDTTRIIGAVDASLQVTGTGGDDSSLSIQRFTADVIGPNLFFGKTRGATISDYTVVQDNDAIGLIAAHAADGTDLGTVPAIIRFEVDDASPAASSIGGAISFFTAPGVASNDLAEVGRFRADGTFNVNNDCIVNSNHVMEGYSTGRNVIRTILIELKPGATPGTNINVSEIGGAAVGNFNIPSITDGTNIAKSGSSGSFSLNAGGNIITLDLTETVIGIISCSYSIHDLNSSSTTESYYPRCTVSGGNLRIRTTKRTAPPDVDWTTILDAGDRADMYICFVTSA